MTTRTAADNPQKGRDRIAMVLLALAALGALLAFFGALGTTIAASPQAQIVESWRMYGFLVFAGLFVLLALWPRHYPGVWELVILHKSATTITAATLLQGATGSSTVVVVDGILTAITFVAYILARGYAGWARLRASGTRTG